MSLLKKQKNKNVVVLAIFSAIASVLFSFFGAPFMRALFISTKSSVFWATAVLIVGIMLVAGTTNYKISETAVYVGAIWMTLGAYSELESRGVRWVGASLISLSSGLLFALAGYFLILKNLTTTDLLAEMVEPLRIAVNKASPDNQQEPGFFIKVLPGIFVASLLAALALSFAFEAKIIKVFKIQHERVASGLRWLEFRLPDATIWIALCAALYTEFSSVRIAVLNSLFSGFSSGQVFLQYLSINLLIVLTVAFFFQGIAIIESLLRHYRLGLFTRIITYVLIILQLAPFVVFVGFVDYWADFRTLVRKKIKTT